MGRARRGDHPLGRHLVGLLRPDGEDHGRPPEHLRADLDRLPPARRGRYRQPRATGHPLLRALPRRRTTVRSPRGLDLAGDDCADRGHARPRCNDRYRRPPGAARNLSGIPARERRSALACAAATRPRARPHLQPRRGIRPRGRRDRANPGQDRDPDPRSPARDGHPRADSERRTVRSPAGGRDRSRARCRLVFGDDNAGEALVHDLPNGLVIEPSEHNPMPLHDMHPEQLAADEAKVQRLRRERS